jgi:hypothetical protein
MIQLPDDRRAFNVFFLRLCVSKYVHDMYDFSYLVTIFSYFSPINRIRSFFHFLLNTISIEGTKNANWQTMTRPVLWPESIPAVR